MNRINHHGMKSTERFNRARRMLFSWLLVGMLLLGSAIPATASTEFSGSERTSGNKNPIAESFRARGANTEETARPETHNGNNSTESLKQARQMMNQQLMVSNRLALDIGVSKKKTGKMVETAKARVKQILKNNEYLTGNQLMALKDIVEQLKQYRDNVGTQERVVMGILDRLQDLRSEGQYADATKVLDELIAARKQMLNIIKNTGKTVSRIGTILKS